MTKTIKAGLCHPDREIGVRIETGLRPPGSWCSRSHPDREIGVRIETLAVAGPGTATESHPDREIGVRIETIFQVDQRRQRGVTPIVRSGCGLKRVRFQHVDFRRGSPRS